MSTFGNPTESQLQTSVQKELDRIQQEEGSRIAVEAGKSGAKVELDIEKGKWTVGAYARYYWNKTWEAAVRATRRW